jgi:membrane protease YdiL (CAAX protease family)
MRDSSFPFTIEVIFAIALLYVVGGVILFIHIGPWEAIRNVAVNGLILGAWLWAANRILRGVPVPRWEPIRFPALELAWALAALAVAVLIAANGYAGWVALPSWTLSVVICGMVLILFVGLRYPRTALGMAWPSKKGWLALLVVIVINFAAAALFQILPPGEAELVPEADLTSRITSPWTVLLLLLGLLVKAALPEELLLRVTLQPRLAQFVPIGWAILIQALLFSTGHLPQKRMGYQEPLMVALGYSLTVNNGLIAGYLWWRTRSLPLLLLLHLFAYPRFGI